MSNLVSTVHTKMFVNGIKIKSSWKEPPCHVTSLVSNKDKGWL